MLPSCKGPHRVKRRKRDQVENHWKGRILAFKVADNGWLAKVQHVYLVRDLVLNVHQQSSFHSFCKLISYQCSIAAGIPLLKPPNCVCLYLADVFPSTAVEWQPVECLSGTFKAIHKELADVIHADKSPSFFKDNNLFVYFSQYKCPPEKPMPLESCKNFPSHQSCLWSGSPLIHVPRTAS